MFRAPFPDHYALNSLLLVAKRFVYLPDRLVTVGVSPKSFGHYYYGGEQRAGAAYLGLSAPASDRLPGSELLNCMRDWLVLLKAAHPDTLAAVSPSQWSYAGRQVYHWMRDFEFGLLDTRELMRRVRLLLGGGERASFVLPFVRLPEPVTYAARARATPDGTESTTCGPRCGHCPGSTRSTNLSSGRARGT